MSEFTSLVAEHVSLAVYFLLVFGWSTLCSIFVAFMPVSLTEKIPNWVMIVVNVSAMNVKNSVNEISDIRGNSK